MKPINERGILGCPFGIGLDSVWYRDCRAGYGLVAVWVPFTSLSGWVLSSELERTQPDNCKDFYRGWFGNDAGTVPGGRGGCGVDSVSSLA